MKKSLLVLLVTSISVFNFCCAQQQKFLDSLESLLPNIEGIEKAVILGELCYQYSLKDIPKATQFGLQGIEAAKKSGDSATIAQSWNDASIPYLYKGDYDSCIILNTLALEYRVSMGDSVAVGKSLSKIANATYEKGDLAKALHHNLRALEIFKEANQPFIVGMLLNNIGNIYDRNKNYDQAINYFNQAIESAEASGVKTDYITAAGNLANAYQRTGKLEESNALYRKLIPIIQEVENNEYLAMVYQGLGVNMRKQKKSREGLVFYEKALKIYQDIGSEVSMSVVQANLGYCYMEKGDFSTAESYFQEALKLAKKTNSDYTLKTAHLGLAQLENRKGNYEKSDSYFDQYIDHMSSIYNENSNKQIAEMQVKYDTEKKEKELAEERLLNAEQELEIKKGNLITTILGAVAILLVISTIFIYWFQRNKNAMQQMEAMQQAATEKLRISRELHDNIGARLTHIISSLDIQLFKNKNSEEISTINSFAKETMGELRETIWAVSDKTIFFSELKQRIEHYLKQTEKMTVVELNYKDHSKVEFELNSAQTINLFRIVQEAINNALKYSQAKEITVAISDSADMVNISVQDNGVGFDVEESMKKGSGLKGIQQRSAEIETTLKIESNREKGSRITIQMKTK